ncbi:MAG: PIN domain-containing protein [Candidatus Aenigmarchaeota archaeon]|nr:PIN domain-containing protein [Candidatus Aenigmarchaeota archaeon]
MVKHHIDTSVFLEPQTTEDGRYCRKYIQKVGRNYEGVVSFPVLSEIFASVLKLDDYKELHDTFDTFVHTFRIRKIGFYSPRDIEDIMKRVKELDKRIYPIDREIVACSLEDKADALVTMNKKLVGNKRIEETFRVRIVHPKALF